jgi:hypothetical protein
MLTIDGFESKQDALDAVVKHLTDWKPLYNQTHE